MRSLWPFSDSSTTPSFRSQLEGKFGLPRVQGHSKGTALCLWKTQTHRIRSNKDPTTTCKGAAEAFQQFTFTAVRKAGPLRDQASSPLSPILAVFDNLSSTRPPELSPQGYEDGMMVVSVNWGCQAHGAGWGSGCLTPSDPMDCSLPGSSIHLFGPAVTRAQPPAFARNSKGSLGFPGPTQEEA